MSACFCIYVSLYLRVHMYTTRGFTFVECPRNCVDFSVVTCPASHLVVRPGSVWKVVVKIILKTKWQAKGWIFEEAETLFPKTSEYERKPRNVRRTSWSEHQRNTNLNFVIQVIAQTSHINEFPKDLMNFTQYRSVCWNSLWNFNVRALDSRDSHSEKHLIV